VTLTRSEQWTRTNKSTL